jgi:glycosyltransferase involved in cell wall biosynthesis
MVKKTFPVVIIDGIFFQINSTGIARVWQNLFKQWSKSGFARNLIVLNRGNTIPKIHGITYHDIALYDYRKSGLDAQNLQSICDRYQADVFISTYYTTPVTTPSVFLAYDMIPEILGMDLTAPEWREKHYGILHASKSITISHNTARDLSRFFPHIIPEKITVAYPGVGEDFFPAKAEDINKFKAKYELNKPYFLFVGTRLSYDDYKNALLLFQAFNKLSNCQDIVIICVGGESKLESKLAALVPNNTSIHLLKLDDDELKCAYSGAMALVYPSRYEGFGLPIAEAMACGCPVITCPNSSIPEVAGKAVWYVKENDVAEMITALEKIVIPEIRDKLIQAGWEQVKQFSWSKMANTIAEVLTETAKEYQTAKVSKNALVWTKLRREQDQQQKLKFLYDESLEKIANLAREVNSLQGEIEYLFTTKAAFRSIIKNLLK